jgi:hypothetical protein
MVVTLLTLINTILIAVVAFLGKGYFDRWDKVAEVEIPQIKDELTLNRNIQLALLQGTHKVLPPEIREMLEIWLRPTYKKTLLEGDIDESIADALSKAASIDEIIEGIRFLWAIQPIPETQRGPAVEFFHKQLAEPSTPPPPPLPTLPSE